MSWTDALGLSHRVRKYTQIQVRNMGVEDGRDNSAGTTSVRYVFGTSPQALQLSVPVNGHAVVGRVWLESRGGGAQDKPGS